MFKKRFTLKKVISDREKEEILKICTDKEGTILIDSLISKIQKEYQITTYDSLEIADEVLLQIGIPATMSKEILDRMHRDIKQKREKERKRLDKLEKERAQRNKRG